MAKEVAGTIASVTASMNKLLGAGTLQSFEDGTADHDVTCVPSGSISLDAALGGGYAQGRMVELYGPESSGKSTLAMEACKQVQDLDLAAGFIDMENAFDPAYGEQLGINYSKEKWVFSQPETGEDCFTIIEALLEVPNMGCIVVDSIACMIPRAEMEGEYGESKMGLHARLMSQGMRKLVGKIKKSNCVVIFINQTREKIGVMFGNPETTPGGNAMKFYASQRLRIGKKVGNKDKEGDIVTNEITVKVIKNKIAPPHRIANFHIRFGEGIDMIKEVLDYGVEMGIIHKGGSWYSYGETKLGQGQEGARNTLEENPDLLQEIYNKIYE